MTTPLSTRDLDRMLQDHAGSLAVPPCRATPDLLLVKAGLAAREARLARVRRVEYWACAVVGAFLLLGLLLAPVPLAGVALGIASALAAGAFAWGLEA